MMSINSFAKNPRNFKIIKASVKNLLQKKLSPNIIEILGFSKRLELVFMEKHLK